MDLQKLLSQTRQAVDTYELIEENDHIAVGISGGKDSLTLLYALKELKRFYPKKFELEAVTVDLGFDNFNLDKIKEFCGELDVNYHIVQTSIADIVFDKRKESNPCSLCAKMRKGAMNNELIRLGCNKIAYAHHKDDFIETMLLSFMFEGRISTFEPKTYLDKTGLTLIRPLLFVGEANIKGFVNKYNLPVAKSPCPMDGNTKREYVKNLLASLNRENPGIKERMFTAICKGLL